ncbi:SemiSWEET transporter [Candidatus Woesearchaeota archaeon]|nr:SemiSWEET transporter [Candidatus Woesearchaeota archaeon]
MIYAEFIGFGAAFLTVISFLPQVIKAYKTKNTRDISLATFLILGIGTLLWIAYGIFLKSLPIIVTNISALALTLIIIIMKIKYR